MKHYLIKNIKKKEAKDFFGSNAEGIYIISIFLIGMLSGIILTLRLN